MYLSLYKKDGERIARQFIEVHDKYDKPLIVTWMAGPEDGKAMLREHGIPVFDEPTRALKSLGNLYRYQKNQQAYHANREKELELEPLDPAEVAAVRAWLTERRKEGTGLSEGESRRVLRAFRFPLVAGDLAATADEAVALAEKLGYPVVMKIDSPHILHKSDVGGVVLNIRSEQDVRDAYDTIMRNVAAHFEALPPINGVLVEKMEKAQAEILLGSQTDPLFGPTVAFGMGGIFVEVLKEISLRVAPITTHDALEMVGELKGSKILDGLRGKPACDKQAVYHALLSLSRMVVEMQDLIREVDINPLFAFEDGVKAGDALVVLY